MSSIDNGGSAFPIPAGETREGHHAPVRGMTMRDYFAAKALATIPAYRTEDVEAWEPRHFASHAYAIADAMIAARSTKKEQDQ